MSELGRNYTLNIQFGDIYREIPLLGQQDAVVKIGTTKHCGVRLPRESFLCDIEITAHYDLENGWSLLCGDNIYFDGNGSLKKYRLDLTHGYDFSVHYEDGGLELARGEFFYSFHNERQVFDRSAEIGNLQRISIGGKASCDIHIDDQLLYTGKIEMEREGSLWRIVDCSTQYGFEVNGSHQKKSAIVGDYDFISIAGYDFYICKNQLYFSSLGNISVNQLHTSKHIDSSSSMEYPKLNRSTRIYYCFPEEKVKLQKPKGKTEPPDRNLFMTVLPMIVMLGAMVLLRSLMGGSSWFIIFSVVSMGVGVITSVYNYFHQKKKAAIDEENRIRIYSDYINRKEQELVELRRQERETAERNTPAIGKVMNTVLDFSGDLYSRMPIHEDFLATRLGTGVKDSVRQVDYPPEEYRATDDELMDWPEQVREKYKRIERMPILLPLKTVGTVGVVGNNDQIYETIKLMTMDLAINHSPTDLHLGFMINRVDQKKWDWVRWLSHVRDNENANRFIAYDEDSSRNLIDRLYKVLSKRSSSKEESEFPHYIVFIINNYEILTHPISRYFSEDKNFGVTFVFCANSAELLPQCKTIVRLDHNQSVIVDALDGNNAQLYERAFVSDTATKQAVRKLAGVQLDEVNLDNQLVKSITLYRLLNIFSADDLDYRANWKSDKILRTLAAPIGVDTKGECVYLDLYERAHGPHGLVAGTTGSGKSELLQTYIISMAASYPPDEVGFVLIDFKGGGMANQFKNLPHIMGAITNIDGKTITRSLKSIRAELNKREKLFADAEVKDIDGYIKKYKAGLVQLPLPHLILIVDEFAELKTDYPDFMKELVSAARVGRSLGVHLILATQKPSGVVDEQIWSNSHFHICLKVESPADSNEMLKSPLAAEIKEPGRAYFQVGNNESFELIQTAYSGAPSDSELMTGAKTYSILELDFAGRKKLVYQHLAEKTSKSEITELAAIVKSVNEYCEISNIHPLPGICLPGLPRIIAYIKQSRAMQSERKIDIGIYDDPERQSQGIYTIDLLKQNVIIIGSSQSGKTNLLQCVIRGIVDCYTPQEITMYIMDYASASLKNYEGLAHVGGVVTAGEDEKQKNLFKLLYHEMKIRKERLNEQGLSSYSAYCESGMTDLPLIVLMVDNLTVVKETLFRDEDPLVGICREGLSLGITVIIANSQTSGVGYRYLSNFSCRIAMYCNDSSEYATLLDHCRERLEDIPGRCIVELEKEYYECQTYLSFEGEKEYERVNNIQRFVKEKKELYQEYRVRNIPVIPEHLTDQMLWDEFKKTDHQKWEIPIGLSYETVYPYNLVLGNIGLMAVLETSKGQKYKFLDYFLRTINYLYPESLECYLVDGLGKNLSTIKSIPGIKDYSVVSSDGRRYLCEIENQLKQRYDSLISQDDYDPLGQSLLLLVLDNADSIADIFADPASTTAYKNIATRYKHLNICIMLTCVENEAISYSANEMLKTLKDNRGFIYFGEPDELKLADVSRSMIRQYGQQVGAGDALYMKNNTCVKLRVPVMAERKVKL